MTANQTKQANDTAQEIAWAVAHAIIDSEDEDLDFITVKQLNAIREIISTEAFSVLQGVANKEIFNDMLDNI